MDYSQALEKLHSPTMQYLDKSSFSQGADFIDARFSGIANFTKAKFSGVYTSLW